MMDTNNIDMFDFDAWDKHVNEEFNRIMQEYDKVKKEIEEVREQINTYIMKQTHRYREQRASYQW